MKVLKYFRDTTPCPYRDGVTIMSNACKLCEHYAGECVSQNMLCDFE